MIEIRKVISVRSRVMKAMCPKTELFIRQRLTVTAGNLGDFFPLVGLVEDKGTDLFRET